MNYKPVRPFWALVVSVLFTVVSFSFPVFAGFSEPDTGGQNRTQLESDYLKVSEGRNVYYNYSKGDSAKPTLVLLPGLNRAVPEFYDAVKLLKSKGYSILITATSAHWQSISTLNRSEAPFFLRKNDLTSKDFYSELQLLIKNLKITSPVLLSLSYSSALAAESDLPKMYVAPLVKSSDSNPSAAKQAAAWEATLALNVFLGPTLIRQFRDYNYNTYWSQTVNAQLSNNSSAYGKAKKGDVIDGYATISRSLENFDLTKIKFLGRSVFVLGERESKVRLRGQIESIMNALKTGSVDLILVRDAEHNILESQPVAYVTAVEALLKSTSASAKSLKVGLIDPKQDPSLIKPIDRSRVEALFREILSYDDSTDSADFGSIL